MKIGFTGTSKGMTPDQKAAVREALTRYKAEGATEFHHGWCINADVEAAAIAKELGYRVIAHPGFNPRNPEGRLYRSDWAGNDEVREEGPFIKRDHDIVDETDRLIAAPLTPDEQIYSGTWTTVRYAKKKAKSVLLVAPLILPQPTLPANPVKTNAVAGDTTLYGPTHRQRGVK